LIRRQALCDQQVAIPAMFCRANAVVAVGTAKVRLMLNLSTREASEAFLLQAHEILPR